MGIVNELQDCVEANDVLTALRKAKRVASKLGRDDISEWIEHELSGYPIPNCSVPDYRQIPTDFAYNTNGHIPAGYGMMQSGIVPMGDLGLSLRFPMEVSISTVLQYIESFRAKSGLYIPAGPEISAKIKSLCRSRFPEVIRQITILHHLHSPTIEDIPQQVSNRILDWALKLERAGIHGEGQSFSKQEQQEAQNVVFNNYSTTITTGDVHGAIQAASPNATQNTSVVSGLSKAIQEIEAAVQRSEELDDTDKADIKTSLSLIRDLSEKERTEKVKTKLTERLNAIWLIVQTCDKLGPHLKPAFEAMKHALHFSG